MKIKDEIVLHGMNRAASHEIEYNNIGWFQTSESNTPVYYFFQWTGNAYNLQEKYTCHAFDPPGIIPEGELFCLAKFMTPMRKQSLLVSQARWSNSCHNEVKISCDEFHWIDSVQQYNK